jgi:tetratricopeptide (TPR) repeat protein
MTLRRRLALLALAIALGPPAPASPQTRDEHSKRCDATDERAFGLDDQIASCTALIDSPAEPPQVKAAAYNNRAVKHSSRRQVERAIDDYTAGLAIAPDDALLLTNRGFAFFDRGIDDRAIADFERAIRAAPEGASAYRGRGLIRAGRGDDRGALADFDDAVRLAPHDARNWNSRCWHRATAMTVSSTELGLAHGDCARSLQLAPHDKDILDSSGFVFLKQRKYREAIDAYTRSLAIDPAQAYSLYGRGVAQHLAGNRRAGEADIAAARRLQPQIVEIFERLGVKAPAR